MMTFKKTCVLLIIALLSADIYAGEDGCHLPSAGELMRWFSGSQEKSLVSIVSDDVFESLANTYVDHYELEGIADYLAQEYKEQVYMQWYHELDEASVQAKKDIILAVLKNNLPTSF
jgi:hypothetical protein